MDRTKDAYSVYLLFILCRHLWWITLTELRTPTRYLIYRTRLEFHTGRSPAAGVVSWDKIRPLCLPDPRSPLYKRTETKTWRRKKKPGAQGNHGRVKHIQPPHTQTHTLHENDRLLCSILFVSSLSPHFSTSSRWKSRMLQCEPPTGPWRHQYTLLQHIWSKIHTHACLHTQTTGRNLQQPHTTNMRHFHTLFYINKQLILTSMKFQGWGGGILVQVLC